MYSIEIKDLTKYYGKTQALNKISFTANEGEILGFIGQNGAGKSTTIRCILNLIYQNSGSIKVFNLDSIKDTKKIKKITSYVPSEVNYYSNVRVKSILKLSANLYNIKDFSEMYKLANFFELDLNKKIQELSLGNKKKISIILSLMKKPKIIILDEPTIGLDPIMQEKLFKTLITEKNKGTTILLSSHNLSDIEKYCDRVVIIKKGKILKIANIKDFNNENEYVITYKKNNKLVSYVSKENVDIILKKLININPTNLEIKHKSVEEKFKKYYEDN